MLRSLIQALLLSAAISLAVAVGGAADAPAAGWALCPNITVLAPIEPPLTDNEKNMACGFQDVKGTQFQAWGEIPASQAMTHLRGFLQSRAYLNPKFTLENSKVTVEPGVKSEITKVIPADATSVEFVLRQRGWNGKPLTPEVLDEIEARTRERLERMGYPCGQVKTRASAQGGVVAVEVAPGATRQFGEVAVSDAGTVPPNVLRRYYAFKPDQTFNRLQLAVSNNRLVTPGVVENSSFYADCKADDTYRVVHEVEPGRPRLLSLGIAADTEDWLELFFNWRQPRIGINASQAGARLFASRHLQELSLYMDYYFLTPPGRLALMPLFAVRRMDEPRFEVTNFETELHVGSFFDLSGISAGGDWSVGPFLAHWHMTDPGSWPGSARAAGLSAAFKLRDYEHELLQQQAPSGFEIGARLRAAADSVGSDFEATWLDVEALNVWNLSGDWPPALQLALRGRLGALQTDQITDVPPPLRQYLGGDRDLRGYSRLQLPGGVDGARTAAALGLELRWNPDPEGPTPIAFIDAGKLGQNELTLDSMVYYSPGIGANWLTPWGLFRGYAAVAMTDSSGESSDKPWRNLRYFLSWGEGY